MKTRGNFGNFGDFGRSGFALALAAGTLGIGFAAAPARADLSAGLVGYYQLGSSAKVNDRSGHFNNGRAVNTTWGADRSSTANAAAVLPGLAGAYLRVDSSSDFNFGTGDFSFSLWLKFPPQAVLGNPGNFAVIFLRSGLTVAPNTGPTVFADLTAGHVTFRDIEGDELTSAASTLNDNAWRHYAFVRENRVLKIYINGTLDSQKGVAAVDVSTAVATAHLYLGANHVTQNVMNLNGSMDELRIYSRALSASEVSTLSHASPVNCAVPSTTASLQAGRFQVTATWSNGGSTTSAYVSCGATTDQTAYFYWTDPGNSELIVKLLDFCSFSSAWSVYANGATDMQVTITITDTVTQATWTDGNPLGQGFQLIRAGAFPCP